MAGREEFVEPSPALARGHSRDDEVDAFGFNYLQQFLGGTDVFFVAGVVHHCTVWMMAEI